MAAAPVKSQPLHNFTLPSYLNWGGAKNQAAAPSHSRHRRSPLAGDSPPVDHSESEAEFHAHRVGSRAARNRFSVSSCVATEEPRREAAAVEKKRDVVEAAEKKREVDDEAEETVQKPWNLRPRRGVISSKPPGFDQNGELTETAPPARAVAAVQQGQNQAKSIRLRGVNGRAGGETEKRRLQIALSREEIEEDIFVITGSRPTRRPKKRPKNVQRQLDLVFPGLWLADCSADDLEYQYS